MASCCRARRRRTRSRCARLRPRASARYAKAIRLPAVASLLKQAGSGKCSCGRYPIRSSTIKTWFRSALPLRGSFAFWVCRVPDEVAEGTARLPLRGGFAYLVSSCA